MGGVEGIVRHSDASISHITAGSRKQPAVRLLGLPPWTGLWVLVLTVAAILLLARPDKRDPKPTTAGRPCNSDRHHLVVRVVVGW